MSSIQQIFFICQCQFNYSRPTLNYCFVLFCFVLFWWEVAESKKVISLFFYDGNKKTKAPVRVILWKRKTNRHAPAPTCSLLCKKDWNKVNNRIVKIYVLYESVSKVTSFRVANFSDFKCNLMNNPKDLTLLWLAVALRKN